MVTIPYSASRTIVPSTIWDFDLAVELIDTVTASGSSSEVTIGDAVFDRVTPATIRKDAQLFAPFGTTFQSLNQSVATVSSSGVVQSVDASGSVGLLAKRYNAIRRYDFTAGTASGQTVDTFSRYASGSAGETITNAMIALLAAPSKSQEIFSSANDSSSTYTRNLDCWVTANLTAIPAWNSRLGSVGNGVAVTNRHIVQARHLSVSVGTTIRFVTQDNSVVERTVSAINDIGTADLRIATLNSDLPVSITPAKVLPADWADDLTIGVLPIVCSDRQRKMIVRDTSSFVSSGTTRYITHTLRQGTSFSEAIVTGDSGSMVGAIVGGELVAFGCHYGPGACPMISAYTTEVNSVLSATGKSLTAVTL